MEIFVLTYIDKNYRKSRMLIQTRHANGRPYDIPVQRLRNERAVLKGSVPKVGIWAVSKSELTNRNLKQLIKYINSMDIGKINQSNEQL
jgi:hypothetical protein